MNKIKKKSKQSLTSYKINLEMIHEVCEKQKKKRMIKSSLYILEYIYLKYKWNKNIFKLLPQYLI